MIVNNHLSLLYIKDTLELAHPELDIFLHTYETFLALYEKMLIKLESDIRMHIRVEQ